MITNSFGAHVDLPGAGGTVRIASLATLATQFPGVATLPYSLKILLENLLRCEDGAFVKADDIEALARGTRRRRREGNRLHARRACCCRTSPACRRWSTSRRCARASRSSGGDPRSVNPLQPVELVIDHSVQVDHFGAADAFDLNAELEYQRNRERYVFLRWGQNAFRQLPRRAARDGHRAPGQPRVPGARRVPRDARRRPRGRTPTRWSAPTRTRP